jgi:hypothetical protein
MAEIKNIRFEERHDYEKGFAQYYQSNIAPIFLNLERLREEKWSKTKIKYFWTAILWVVSLVIGPTMEYQTGVTFFVVVCISSILININFGEDYNVTYKKQVLPPIFNFFGDFVCKINMGRTSDEYLEGFMVVPSYSSGVLGVQLKGVYQGIEVLFEGIKLYRNMDNQSNIEFSGLAIQINLPESFNKRIVAQYNDPSKLGLRLGNKFGSKLEKVKIENPEFEELFELYSTDPKECLNTLNDHFLNCIFEIKELWQGGVQFEFKKNQLLILLELNDDPFDPPSVKKSVYDLEKLRLLVHRLRSIFNIVDTLKPKEATGF